VRWPDAEIPIDEALVRRLLEDQQQDLAGLPLQLCDAGWDNVMWRLGADLAVRVPRRAVAAPLIENEQRWVPELAARLTLPVPVPLRAGQPTAYYPWHWSVVPWLEGSPGDRTLATDVGLTAPRLGSFLRAMHRPAPPGAPFNPYRSGPVESRADTFEERMAKLADHVDEGRLRKVWETGLSCPVYAGPPLWLHGDLHPANTLVLDGAVVAVIDFGDLCAGDPAVDVGAASMSVPDEGEAAFWTAYGGPDPDLAGRARAWAVLFALMLLEIGLEDRPTYASVGRSTLDRLARRAGG
jgi:aminoglycoside phosphotransferase (APT) family kinase protein